MIKESLAFVLLAGLVLTFLTRHERAGASAPLLTLRFPQASASAPSLTLRFPQSGDSSVDAFWSKFKFGVIKSGKSAVADMVKFPVEMPYGFPPIKTRSQLLRRYREVFSVQADARKCFAGAQPVIDPNDPNRFTVGCKDSAGNEVVVYGFLRTKSGWKLIFLDNINE